MTREQIKRMEVLADHLDGGKLGHEVFRFDRMNVNELDRGVPNRCGYAGCAMGELPIVFPDAWRFDGVGGMSLIVGSTGSGSTDADVALFFGVDRDGDVGGLFYPEWPRAWAEGMLGNDASPKEVAAGMRAYLKWKEREDGESAD